MYAPIPTPNIWFEYDVGMENNAQWPLTDTFHECGDDEIDENQCSNCSKKSKIVYLKLWFTFPERASKDNVLVLRKKQIKMKILYYYHCYQLIQFKQSFNSITEQNNGIHSRVFENEHSRIPVGKKTPKKKFETKRITFSFSI